MAGRASYQRSQDRVEQIKWWDDEYNAKFNYVAHSWPGLGDMARWYEDAKYMDYQLGLNGMDWTDIRWMNKATGSSGGRGIFANAITYSKNLLDLYR